jgi:hypothetical protein
VMATKSDLNHGRSRHAEVPHPPAYGTFTVSAPGLMKVIKPSHTHFNGEVLSTVGKLARSTVGAPGSQGAGMLEMQGMGVRAPIYREHFSGSDHHCSACGFSVNVLTRSGSP